MRQNYVTVYINLKGILWLNIIFFLVLELTSENRVSSECFEFIDKRFKNIVVVNFPILFTR